MSKLDHPCSLPYYSVVRQWWMQLDAGSVSRSRNAAARRIGNSTSSLDAGGWPNQHERATERVRPPGLGAIVEIKYPAIQHPFNHEKSCDSCQRAHQNLFVWAADFEARVSVEAKAWAELCLEMLKKAPVSLKLQSLPLDCLSGINNPFPSLRCSPLHATAIFKTFRSAAPQAARGHDVYEKELR